MKALSLLLTALACFFAGHALAADMPVKYVAAPAAPLPSWTGYYIGVGVGYAFDAPIETDLVGKFNSRGVTLGAYAGHNWQAGPLVLGIELSADWDGHKGTRTVAVGETALTAAGKVDLFGAARARVGLLTTNDSLLWYVAGGLGLAHQTANLTVATLSSTAAATSFGPVAGAGVEWRMLSNVVVRLNYDHYFMGRTTLPFGGAIQANVPSKLDIDTLKLGLAIKFN